MDLETRIKKQQEKAQKAQEKARKEQEQLMKLQLESFEKMRPILSKHNIKTADDLKKHFDEIAHQNEVLEQIYKQLQDNGRDVKTVDELVNCVDEFVTWIGAFDASQNDTNSSAQ